MCLVSSILQDDIDGILAQLELNDDGILLVSRKPG